MSNSTFWSRRQAAVAEEALAEQEAAKIAETAEAEAALEERDDAEILAELELPEPEALDSPEAVRDFLNSAVPQRLKTRALRRLWRLNPLLANLDGLVDYGEDYTDAATVIENMQTAYQVGKGMLSHIEALAEKAEAEAEAELAKDADIDTATSDDTLIVETDDSYDDTDVALADDHALQPPEGPMSDPSTETYEELDDEPLLTTSRRRMTFHFEATA